MECTAIIIFKNYHILMHLWNNGSIVMLYILAVMYLIINKYYMARKLKIMTVKYMIIKEIKKIVKVRNK